MPDTNKADKDLVFCVFCRHRVEEQCTKKLVCSALEPVYADISDVNENNDCQDYAPTLYYSIGSWLLRTLRIT